MYASVARDRDLGMSVGVHIAQIDGVVGACGHRGITAGADALGVGDGAYLPGQAVVGRDRYTGSAYAVGVQAVLVGNVDGPIRRDPHVAMQSAAGAGCCRYIYAIDVSERIDRYARTKGKAAIITARAEGGHNVLRTIVDGVRIRSSGQRRRRGKRAAPNGLMVNTRGLA